MVEDMITIRIMDAVALMTITLGIIMTTIVGAAGRMEIINVG